MGGSGPGGGRAAAYLLCLCTDGFATRWSAAQFIVKTATTLQMTHERQIQRRDHFARLVAEPSQQSACAG
jgi:hypothetical protein